jgi:hypothetical protein
MRSSICGAVYRLGPAIVKGQGGAPRPFVVGLLVGTHLAEQQRARHRVEALRRKAIADLDRRHRGDSI